MMNSPRSDEVNKLLLDLIQTRLKEEVEQEQKRIDTLAKPINQKVGYIIGILRNRFDDFDIKVASKILNNYVEASLRFGYSDLNIEAFLSSVTSETKQVESWEHWKSLMESLTKGIGK